MNIYPLKPRNKNDKVKAEPEIKVNDIGICDVSCPFVSFYSLLITTLLLAFYKEKYTEEKKIIIHKKRSSERSDCFSTEVMVLS